MVLTNPAILEFDLVSLTSSCASPLETEGDKPAETYQSKTIKFNHFQGMADCQIPTKILVFYKTPLNYPPKTNMAMEKTPFFNKKYIFIHGWLFHCHVNFPGCNGLLELMDML